MSTLSTTVEFPEAMQPLDRVMCLLEAEGSLDRPMTTEQVAVLAGADRAIELPDVLQGFGAALNARIATWLCINGVDEEAVA